MNRLATGEILPPFCDLKGCRIGLVSKVVTIAAMN